MSFKLTELQEKWLQALESGAYPQQDHGRLRDSTGFCCLGVACEVVGVCSSPVDYNAANWVVAYGNSESTAFPPAELMDALHLHSGREGAGELMQMNDEMGLSFAQIAAVVRANPTHYFTKGAE